MLPAAALWYPTRSAMDRVDSLIPAYRRKVVACLEPLVRTYYPALLRDSDNEYRKMVELSTKMTLVGHACTEVAGYGYDSRRRMIGCLFGGCCFLADSFLDDFGAEVARDYLARFEILLTQGWFEVKTDRERLFYVVVARLFAERDVLHPMLRQAILLLYEAQKQDVEVRQKKNGFGALARQRRLGLLEQCARDRSGHAIAVLSGFLVPELRLTYLNMIFAAGALIMHIDDHGDCYSDLYYDRLTYMNQVRNPARTLQRIFVANVERLFHGLPENAGRDLLIAFLTRYYLTRLEKHKLQKRQGAAAWEVYE